MRQAASVVVVVAAMAWAQGVAAQEAATAVSGELEEVQHALHVQTGLGLQDQGSVEVGWQGRFTERLRLGFEAQGASYREAYIEALKVEDGLRARVSAMATLAFFERGPMTTHLLVAPGLYMTQAPDDSGLDNGVAVGATAGLIFQMKASDRLSVETGALVPYVQEVAPESLMEKNGLLIPAWVGWWVTDGVQLYGGGQFGPLTGGDGDTAKFLVEASVGLRVGFDGVMDALLTP